MEDGELSFQKVHDIFWPKIFRYLTRLVGKQDAEDLTQEVFVKVSQALNTFRCDAQLSTWIYRIATNAALDRLRSPDTVKIRLHRARTKLKQELENLCSFYHDERNVLSCDLKSAIRQLKESD